MGEDGEKIYRTVTQYSMKPIEEIGLLKMDFLGLRNLDVIEDALDIIERSSGSRIDMATLPLDDTKTYEMMARGDAVGVFQFESEGMREALKKVRRPSSRTSSRSWRCTARARWTRSPTYAKGKRNPDSISYIDDRLRPITEATKGVILYQEQSMQIAKALGGFSGPRADDLRKAIGKKNRQAMAELKPEFVAGCRASGTAEHVIEQLWSTNEKSADYSFNRSHAACYALIAYRTAWLKANYPAEYMAALISSVMSTKDKVPFFVARCEEMGIEILPPDVNLSDHEFMVVEGNIRFGLDAVKGVGYAAVEAIKRAREEGGPFTSLWDFCERVDCRTVNKKAIEALIKCGAFGSTGASRAACSRCSRPRRAQAPRPSSTPQIGQGSIFDLARPTAAPRRSRRRPIRRSRSLEFDRPELLAAEKESIGLFISDHPLKRVREALLARADCPCAEVIDRKDGEWIRSAGWSRRPRRSAPAPARRSCSPRSTTSRAPSRSSSSRRRWLPPRRDGARRDRARRGRVDHKEGGKVCVVVQEVERFDPSDAEIEKARAQALKAAEPPKPLS